MPAHVPQADAAPGERGRELARQRATACYLRDIERDDDAFDRIRTGFFPAPGLDSLPASPGIQARPCRSELLVEVEAMALLLRVRESC